MTRFRKNPFEGKNSEKGGKKLNAPLEKDSDQIKKEKLGTQCPQKGLGPI